MVRPRMTLHCVLALILRYFAKLDTGRLRYSGWR